MTELQIPRVGCGAVVRDADGRILLIQRGRDPERGHWGLPGGKVDWMETVEAAVVRETREETALEVTLQRLLCLADHFEPTLAQHWVAPIFEAPGTCRCRGLHPGAGCADRAGLVRAGCAAPATDPGHGAGAGQAVADIDPDAG